LRDKFRERAERLSPEQKQQLREKLERLSPEEKKALRQQFKDKFNQTNKDKD
jgi:uncharacterized protein (UPF0335 family)